MIMRVVVYDVAASGGGALSVLLQYYEEAINRKGDQFLFIVGNIDLDETENVKVHRAPEAKKSWTSRLRFDICDAHKLVDDFQADEVVSLQNLMIPFTHCPQTVYLHNALPKPFCEQRFSLRKYPKLWVYQNVIGRMIVYSLRSASKVVVQTNWMAKRCIEKCGVDEDKVVIERFGASSASDAALMSDKDADGATSYAHDGAEVVFFYPASAEPFKNHRVIVEACSLLTKRGINDFSVKFTLNGDESEEISVLRKRVDQENLPIKFCGWQTQEQMRLAYEDSSCLLFPSTIETLGLPLEEAKAYGLNIIAADLEYAHETAGEYSLVKFFPPNSADSLAGEMQLVILARKRHEQGKR